MLGSVSRVARSRVAVSVAKSGVSGASASVSGASRSSVWARSALPAALVAGSSQAQMAGASVRWMSSGKGEDEGSHPDFAAQSKVTTSDSDELQEFLTDAVKTNDVLLFMKGTPHNPRCGFSARVVQVLQAEGVNFSSADVLADAEIREGVKKFS